MKMRTKIKQYFVLFIITSMFIFTCFAVSARGANAADAPELDYTFEDVPVENIEITVDDEVSSIQPRQSFTLSYEVSPWYTTTPDIYFNVFPKHTATVTEVSKIAVSAGRATGRAKITVSENAAVGSTFTVTAGADGVESNAIEMSVGKIPVTGLKLLLTGNDDKLHIGKTRTVSCQFTPSYATLKDVRYELSGNGVKYIESFDENSGVIKAKDDIASLDVNSTVTVTAYSVDNPGAFDSVTLLLFMPSTIVDISATTPLGRVTSDNKPLAVAGSTYGDTVLLHTKINGVNSSGLPYVIVKGQEYVENGHIQTGGAFTLRPTANWTPAMEVAHPEIRIKVAYSDGFDEIIISVYIPVERIEFTNSVPTEAENFRSYHMQAQAFPKFASLIADNDMPLSYSLNGLDSSIAEIDGDGLLKLPKSYTSRGSVIDYSANLTNAWIGVDAAPLTHSLTVVPVYATGFKSVTVMKDGAPVSLSGVKVLPADVLQVEVTYTVDNVTEVGFSLSENSAMLSTDGNLIHIAGLNAMESDNPYVNVVAAYHEGGNHFTQELPISIYVPAETAEIADAPFKRDEQLNLNDLVTVNGHGFASNKSIEWGEPTVEGYTRSITASCDNGFLNIDAFATAGTIVRVPYRAFDSEAWQIKEFVVAALDGRFALSYGETFNSTDSRKYVIDPEAPQLEEGQSVDLYLKYNGVGAAENFGLRFSVSVSHNAELTYYDSNREYDIFRLLAKSGQSGRNNTISYIITIYDGTETYCMRTNDTAKPANISIDEKTKFLAIFKRISGTIDVSNISVEVGSTFNLNGWDGYFTFNQDDLVWKLSGGAMEKNKILTAPNQGFVLTVSAAQKYNGADISFSSKITFSSVIYKNGTQTVKRNYKKQGSSINLADKICDKQGFIQTGWSISKNGSKKYSFYALYSENKDLTLYPYWVKTQDIVQIAEEKTMHENQNKDIYTNNAAIDLNFATLRSLGYTKVEVDIHAMLQRTYHSGNFAKLWLQINDVTVFVKDKFEPSSSKEVHYISFTMDITEFSDSSSVKLGFYAYDDGKFGKFTWKFYSADISFTAIK